MILLRHLRCPPLNHIRVPSSCLGVMFASAETHTMSSNGTNGETSMLEDAMLIGDVGILHEWNSKCSPHRPCVQDKRCMMNPRRTKSATSRSIRTPRHFRVPFPRQQLHLPTVTAERMGRAYQHAPCAQKRRPANTVIVDIRKSSLSQSQLPVAISKLPSIARQRIAAKWQHTQPQQSTFASVNTNLQSTPTSSAMAANTPSSALLHIKSRPCHPHFLQIHSLHCSALACA